MIYCDLSYIFQIVLVGSCHLPLITLPRIACHLLILDLHIPLQTLPLGVEGKRLVLGECLLFPVVAQLDSAGAAQVCQNNVSVTRRHEGPPLLVTSGGSVDNHLASVSVHPEQATIEHVDDVERNVLDCGAVPLLA